MQPLSRSDRIVKTAKGQLRTLGVSADLDKGMPLARVGGDDLHWFAVPPGAPKKGVFQNKSAPNSSLT